MNTYRVSGHRPVLDIEPGGLLEHEFTAAEEADLLEQHRLELVPRRYRVIGHRQVNGTDPGKEFEAALRVGQEAALLEAGHIEIVAGKPAAKTTKEK